MLLLGERRLAEASKFGEWLSQAREAKGWSGERLAEEAGTSQGNISMYERGDRNPKRPMIAKICKALGVDESQGLFAAGLLPDNLIPGTKVLLPNGLTITVPDPFDPSVSELDKQRVAAILETFFKRHRQEEDDSE